MGGLELLAWIVTAGAALALWADHEHQTDHWTAQPVSEPRQSHVRTIPATYPYDQDARHTDTRKDQPSWSNE